MMMRSVVVDAVDRSARCAEDEPLEQLPVFGRFCAHGHDYVYHAGNQYHRPCNTNTAHARNLHSARPRWPCNRIDSRSSRGRLGSMLVVGDPYGRVFELCLDAGYVLKVGRRRVLGEWVVIGDS